MRIILHVGMPKCGSSALQTYLSSQEFLEKSSGKYSYAALHNNGEVVYGRNLVERARKNKYGYCVSLDPQLIYSQTKSDREKALRSLNKITKKNKTAILSCEAWGAGADIIGASGIFDRKDLEIEVVAWVRPQCDWINSAWWQWGAWSGKSFDQWYRYTKNKCLWGDLLSSWERQSWVNNVSVKLLKGNVVNEFLSMLDLKPVADVRKNLSLPGSLLRFFQMYPELRPDPHRSASLEFSLSRHVDYKKGQTPWVLPRGLVNEVVDNSRESNEKLRTFLSQRDQDGMIEDGRWFESSAYEKKEISDPHQGDLSKDEVEELLLASIKAIDSLDTKYRSG